MITPDISKPEMALVEKAPSPPFASPCCIPESRLRDMLKKVEERAATMTTEERLESHNAFKVVSDIYPHLRLGSVTSDEPYDIRREKFKSVIDRLEIALVTLDKYYPEEIPAIHKFTPGMYIREIHVQAGSIFTSVTHKTEHPFVISKGICDICNEVGDVTRYSAPYTGITQPGTRRVFLVHDDLIITTFHVTEITDPDEWVRENTGMENETLPADINFKCFSRKEITWRA